MPSLSTPPPIVLPRRFRWLETLGAGGQASVYLVEDLERDGEPVAMKVMLGDPAATPLDSFRREFLTLAALAHPTLARVRDFGYLDDNRRAYFTADYVAGRNLLRWYAESPTEAARRTLPAMAAQALSALAYLRRRGIQHGDVKPQNLLVEEDPRGEEAPPRVRLVDFGSVRLRGLLGGGGDASSGTPAYMPPPGDPAIDPDLYALGISLFHVVVGHLPFALGDESALHDWWRRGETAVPSRFTADVPDVLDELVRRLTSRTGGFRAPRDALDFLAARVELPRSLSRFCGERLGFYGRQELLAEILSLSERQGSGAVLLAGPPGSGKSRFIEALRLRSQVAGRRVHVLDSPGDERSLAEFLSPAADREPQEATGPAYRALDVVACLEAGTLLVIDDAESCPFAPVVAELVRYAADAVDPGKRLVVVLATASPESVLAELNVPAGCFRRRALDGLDRATLTEMARDYFAVEDVPVSVLDLIEESSSGEPGALREVLGRLEAAGMAVDFLGELQVPEGLPRAIDVRGSTGRPAESRLGRKLHRQLRLLRSNGAPLTASEIAWIHPECSSAEWLLGLDELYYRGHVRRLSRGGEPRYAGYESSASEPRADGESTGREPPARAVLEQIERGLASGRLSSPEVHVARVRQLLAARQRLRAARAALVASRLFEARGRGEEARAVLEESLDGARRPSGRAQLLARLRLADLCLRLGRARDVRRWVGRVGSADPAWFAVAAGFRSGLSRERLGDVSGAIRDLEKSRALLDERANGVSPVRELAFHEVQARLARLYFQAGRLEEARRALKSGRQLLRGGRLDGPPAALASVLGVFASCELEHGDSQLAGRLLEEALAVARAAGDEELLREPLNGLAVYYAGKERLEESLGIFEELEAVLARRGERFGELLALCNQAHVCLRLQWLERSEELYRKACRISDGLGRHAYSAAVWVGLAVVLRERGSLVAALRLYRRVLRLRAVLRRNDLILTRNNLGELYLAFGRLRRSLDERRAAVEAARQLGNRYLLGLTLRGLGATLWAAGRPHEAVDSLQESLEVLRRSGDPRHEGGCLYLLGRVEHRELDGPERTRRLLPVWRRARHLSRKRGERRYEDASLLALLDELVRRDRRRLAAKLLARRLRAPEGQDLRWPFLARALVARTAASWPAESELLFQSLGDGVARGELWESLLVADDALRDPRTTDEIAERLREYREVIVNRMTRRLTPEEVRDVRGYWLDTDGAADAPGGDKGAAGETPGGGVAHEDWGSYLLGLARRDGSQGELDLSPIVEEILTRLVGVLPAAGAWLVGGAEDRTLFHRGRGSAPRPRALLEGGGDAVESLLTASGVSSAPRGLAVGLGRSRRRLLYVEEPPGGWPPSELASLGKRLEAAAAAIDLLFELRGAQESLAVERAAHRKVREELRRLSAAMSEDKALLDTALITRRLELVEALQGSGSLARSVTEPLAASRSMKDIMSRLPRLAASDLPVLIVGESGVGKDLIARWLHFLSPRRDGVFLAEVCLLPESLLEAELFGFVRGAFTDAMEDRAGLLRRADGGTLYLDEIAELTAALQTRLLGVLAQRRVRPLGSDEEVPVDFRLISSTRHVNVEELEANGLRPELFFRLRGQLLVIPPLRERPEDIVLLATHHVASHARLKDGPPPHLPPRTIDKLLAHSWPGNVRELENELTRALVENPRGEIGPELILREGAAPASQPPVVGRPRALREARDAFEREFVLGVLRDSGGNATRAAEALKVTRRHLGKLLEKHAIDLRDVKHAVRPAGPQEKTERGKRRTR